MNYVPFIFVAILFGVPPALVSAHHAAALSPYGWFAVASGVFVSLLLAAVYAVVCCALLVRVTGRKSNGEGFIAVGGVAAAAGAIIGAIVGAS